MIAKRSLLTEGDVARKANQLALRAAATRKPDDRTAHVGFYLIDKGRRELEQASAMRLSPRLYLAKLGRASRCSSTSQA